MTLKRIRRFVVVFGLFSFIGRAPVALAQPCDGITTRDLESCHLQDLKAHDAVLEKYTRTAVQRLEREERADALRAFREGEKAWRAFREQECRAVGVFFAPGSIADLMDISCQREMTKERTHEVWRNWLTYLDSTPPILPEPGRPVR